MEITELNNFCRVFELPKDYPKGFLFGGGKPVSFVMIDWFNAIPPTYLMQDGTIKVEGIIKTWDEVKKEEIIPWLKRKNYCLDGCKYLVITDFDDCFIFSK